MKLLKILLLNEDRKLLQIVYFSLFLSLSLNVFRYFYFGTLFYTFLLWNLFLAFIPFVISLLMQYYERTMNFFIFGFLFMFWLVFFPNAPYILTDLFHLRLRPPAPLWFDLILILSPALNGLFLGYISLMKIQSIIERRYSAKTGWFIAVFSLILGAFGVYIGRFMRWNSWDIVSNPKILFFDIFHEISHPLSNQGIWGMTVFFSLFLISGYLMIRQLVYLNSCNFSIRTGRSVPLKVSKK